MKNLTFTLDKITRQSYTEFGILTNEQMIWEPNASKISDDILKRFETNRDELKQKIEGAKEFVEKGTIISSPANRNIDYKLETVFDIIISHKQRHLEQAKEILQLMKNNNIR